MAQQYTALLGCNFYMQPSNVVPFVIGNEKLFIALFSLDVGCSGGTAMSRPVIAAFRKTRPTGSAMYVAVEYSGPFQTPGANSLPAAVPRIYMEDGVLRYEALDLDAKDALCCPSLAVKGRLDFKEGRWQATQQF